MIARELEAFFLPGEMSLRLARTTTILAVSGSEEAGIGYTALAIGLKAPPTFPKASTDPRYTAISRPGAQGRQARAPEAVRQPYFRPFMKSRGSSPRAVAWV